jgi:hypothetical protein
MTLWQKPELEPGEDRALREGGVPVDLEQLLPASEPIIGLPRRDM